MIKVSAPYPNSGATEFDMDYYLNKHIPMVQTKLGAACRGVSVDQGLAGGAPGAPATYSTMGHLLFDSVDAFLAVFGPNAEAIMGDIPNFTNVSPVLQISDIKL